jgi:mitochondrial fission protein ELM1
MNTPTASPSAPPPTPGRPFVLLLDDGRVGHRRQAAALVRAAGVSVQRLAFELVPPWRWTAPRGLPGWRAFHRELRQGLPEAAPAAVLGCGRRAALASRWLRGAWTEPVSTIQMLDPGVPPGRFDCVIAPRHDGLEGPNVITVTGSLNPVDDPWLAAAARSVEAGAGGPAPTLAVLLGGPVRRCRLGAEDIARDLARVLGRVPAHTRSQVVVTARTPAAWVRTARDVISADRRALDVVEWPAAEARYFAALARAEHLAVTADSVNLLSEACACGKPVHILGAGSAQGRLGLFVGQLVREGRAWAAGAPVPERLPPPLREADRVAAELVRRGCLPAPAAAQPSGAPAK